MKFTLLPELTDAKKRDVGNWIRATLESPELVQNAVPYSWAGEFAIYKNGRMVVLHRNNSWQYDGSGTLYIGYRDGPHQVPLIERLAVVGALISLVELWPEFHEQFTARASAILIETYTGVMSGMVQTEAAVSGLAFNEDRSLVAARIGDCYHLPSGELVEIDDSWTVVADRPDVRAVPVVVAA
jgi:hypothetical protein